MIVIAALMNSCVQKSLITPKELLCEAKTNPTGIATAQPRFSWKNETHTNHSHQTGYQILVASSPSLLTEGKSDLWNSGKTDGMQSVWIPYEGKTLQSRSVAYWKIKVWDQTR